MKLTKIMLVGIVTASTLFNLSLVAQAEDATPPAEAKTIKSKGDVTFKVDDSTNPPVDPTKPDPEEPAESTDPETPGGTSGPLSIDHVSNFHFGSRLISAVDTTYFAALETIKFSDGSTKEVPNYVQVTDKRGSNEGWILTVKQDKQLATAENVELDGAKIKLINSQVKTTEDNRAGAPTTPVAEMELRPDGSLTDVLVAAEGNGMGLWVDGFGTEETAATSVSLFVPGESAKQASSYSTELTWTLSNTSI